MGSVNWNITPPQVDTPTEFAAKGMQLRHLGQQSQIADLQMQEGQIHLQEARADQQDQQTSRQAMIDSGGDMPTYQRLLMQRGASAKMVQASQMQQLESQTKYATLSKTQLENAGLQHDQLRGALAGFESQPDDVKKATYADWLQQQVQRGSLPRSEYQHMVQLHGDTYPGAEQMKVYGAQLATGTQQVKEEQERRTADSGAVSAKSRADAVALNEQKFAVEQPGLAADAAAKARANNIAQLAPITTPAAWNAKLNDLKVPYGTYPDASQMFDATGKPILAAFNKLRQTGMNPDQQATTEQAATNAAQTARHQTIEEGQGAARLNVERGRLNMEQNRFGFEQNGGVSPTAQMAASGKMDPQTIRMIVRSNPGILNQIQQVDPNFDMANLDNRYQTLKEFTSTSVSKAGGQSLALNTMIHHADLYMQAANAMKNGTFKPGNAAYNAVATMFGSAPPTNAALIGRFFAGETAKLATGGVPAEGELNAIARNLDGASSPDQIAGAAKTLLQIGAGRAIPLIERAKSAKIDNIVHVIGPDAQAILARNGIDPNTMKQAGQGSAPHITTKAQFDALPSGTVYTESNGKQYRKP